MGGAQLLDGKWFARVGGLLLRSAGPVARSRWNGLEVDFGSCITNPCTTRLGCNQGASRSFTVPPYSVHEVEVRGGVPVRLAGLG